MRVKCIHVPYNRSSSLTLNKEYDVYSIDLVVKPDGEIYHVFLIIGQKGFTTVDADNFIYETKLEQVLK